MNKLCGSCVFWQDTKPYRGRAWGECRRNAPNVAGQLRAKWPKTVDIDWCGQWEGAGNPE